MSAEKLSSLISLIVAIVILGASFFKWYDAAWNGAVLTKAWVKWLLAICIAALFVAGYLIIVA